MPVTKLVEMISQSSDRIWLDRCREHNRQIGNAGVVEAVSSRLAELDFRDALELKLGENTIEGRVAESLRVYRAFLKHKHQRNQAAGYTEREIRNYGAKQALIRTIRRARKTDGLMMLLEHGRLDCSYEQIAIDFATELPIDVVEQAKHTLASLPGY